MTVLADLLNGSGGPVLQTCRFEGLGGALYGREAIGDRLAALRPGLAASPTLDFESDRLGVWMDDAHAVIADLTDGLVRRLWLLSDRLDLEPPPAVDVPIDPDLAQASPRIRFEPKDHPGLKTEDAGRILSAIMDWPDLDLARPRPVVLRAASDAGIVAALIRLEGESLGEVSTPIGFNGLIVAQDGSVLHRADGAGEARSRARTWTPRL